MWAERVKAVNCMVTDGDTRLNCSDHFIVCAILNYVVHLKLMLYANFISIQKNKKSRVKISPKSVLLNTIQYCLPKSKSDKHKI